MTTRIRIVQRGDTLARWTEFNPVLYKGEISLVTDLSPIKMKIGNGVDSWNSLTFFGEEPGLQVNVPNQAIYADALGSPDRLGSTYLGWNSGYNSIAGTYNTGVGVYSLEASSNNTKVNAFGYSAGSGSHDNNILTLLGEHAGISSYSNSVSTFIGANSGNASYNNDTAMYIGVDTGKTSHHNQGSTYIGQEAGIDSHHNMNVFAGGFMAALDSSYNTLSDFIGHHAGTHAANNDSSSYFGYMAGEESSNNIITLGIGYQAGQKSQNSNKSSFIGFMSGAMSSGNQDSTFLGFMSGRDSVSNQGMMVAGFDAGHASQYNTRSAFIGAQSGMQSTYNVQVDYIGMLAGINSHHNYQVSALGLLAGVGSQYNGHQNGPSAFIGALAGNGAKYNNSASFIGISAGQNAEYNTHVTYIGGGAGSGSQNNEKTTIIGFFAGSPNGFLPAVLTDYNDSSILIGNYAGSGANHTNSLYVFGEHAGSNAQNIYNTRGNSYSSNTMYLGHQAGANTSYISQGLYIGTLAGINSNNNDKTTIIGHQAGAQSYGNSQVSMYGFMAGDSSYANVDSDFFGFQAATSAYNIDSSIIMGHLSGVNAHHLLRTVHLGLLAGGGTYSSTDTIFIGTNTAYASHDNIDTIFIGTDTGLSASTCSTSVFIGKSAGNNATNLTDVIALGTNAVPTKSAQFALSDNILHTRLRGIDYEMPDAQGAIDTALGNDGTGKLSWVDNRDYKTRTNVNTMSLYNINRTYIVDDVNNTLVDYEQINGRVGGTSIASGLGVTIVGHYGISTYTISNDGINWITFEMTSGQTASEIIFANNMFIIVGVNMITRGTYDATEGSYPFFIRWDTVYIGTETLTDVCFANNMFVAIPNVLTSYIALKSTDGITWSECPLPVGDLTGYAWLRISGGGNSFVIIGQSPAGAIFAAGDENADNWTVGSFETLDAIQDIAYGTDNTLTGYVVVGQGENLYTSLDGISWAAESVNFCNRNKIEFINNMFIILAYDYYSNVFVQLRSNDAWVDVNTLTSYNYHDAICFSNELGSYILLHQDAKTVVSSLTNVWINYENSTDSTFAVGDKILIKDQNNKAENGIYVVNLIDDTNHYLFMQRSPEFDTYKAVSKLCTVFVKNNLINTNAAFLNITDNIITKIEFIQL